MLWVASIQSIWNLQQWGALIPNEIGLSSSMFSFKPLGWHFQDISLIQLSLVYRTNTFPVIHAGFFHAFMNILALTPLLERFEAEHGTLLSVALFVGRKC
jgi:glycosylphosphatidylinositol transamidase